MAEVQIPLIGPAWDSRCKDISAQITLNMYPEINPEGKTVVSLHAFPGIKEWTDVSATLAAGGVNMPPGKDRGLYVFQEQLVWAYTDLLFSIAEDGAVDNSAIIGSERVEMADNGTRLVVATGARPYISLNDNTPTVTPITDADISAPHTVTNINGQFVLDDSEGASFKTTQVAAALSATDFVDAADVAGADSYGDNILRAVTLNQAVYFFCTGSREAWWNSGIGDPPFDLIQGSVRREGLAGRWAVTWDKDAMFFLDATRTPRMLRGFDSVPIGNPPLGKEFASYASVSDCEAVVYTLDDQRFLQLNFPSADRTWCWHEPSNSWFQLSSGINLTRHALTSYAYCYDKHIVACGTSQKLYELDFDTYTDHGNAVRRVRRTANIHSGLYGTPGQELIFDRVEFDVETGVGLATGQGSDPQLMVRFSDDGGRTWSAEQWHPMGVAGDYLRRVVLTQQGRAYNRVYELAYSEPTRFSLISAKADIKVAT